MGRDLWIAPNVRIPTQFLGSHYGGWGLDVRKLGPESVIYSFGIGEDASFDLALIDACGCRVQAFDPTPKSLAWVGRNITEQRFKMHPWALAGEDGELELWLPENPDHVSATLAPTGKSSRESFRAPCFTLATILRRLEHERVDVLKMDIEGAEYEVLQCMAADRSIERVGQLLVEFHHWMPPFRRDDTRKALNLLKQEGFHIAWVSGSGHEVLFSR